MSASPRTISTAPDFRQALAVVGTLILATVLLLAVTVGRQASLQRSTSTVVPAAVANDHGWSTANGSQELVVRSANGALRYTGIPYPTGNRSLIVTAKHGAVVYTGIPYPAPVEHVGGGNGTRFAQ
jgi:hypothetical protein